MALNNFVASLLPTVTAYTPNTRFWGRRQSFEKFSGETAEKICPPPPVRPPRPGPARGAAAALSGGGDRVRGRRALRARAEARAACRIALARTRNRVFGIVQWKVTAGQRVGTTDTERLRLRLLL
jgi:hypothetical protein